MVPIGPVWTQNGPNSYGYYPFFQHYFSCVANALEKLSLLAQQYITVDVQFGSEPKLSG